MNEPIAAACLELRRKVLKPRGRPPKETPKEPIHIRLSPEVLAYFRATGKGWQTRIDEALKEWIAGHD